MLFHHQFDVFIYFLGSHVFLQDFKFNLSYQGHLQLLIIRILFCFSLLFLVIKFNIMIVNNLFNFIKFYFHPKFLSVLSKFFRFKDQFFLCVKKYLIQWVMIIF